MFASLDDACPYDTYPLSLACKILNTMTSVGMPDSHRVG